MSAARQDGGFTLVELMISIALMALVTTMMAASLHVGIGAWRREQAGTDAAAEMLAAHDVLTRLLSQSEPVYASPLPSDPALAFDGTAQELRFVAPMRSGAGGSVLVRVLLKLDPAAQDGALLLAAESDLAEPMPAEAMWPRDTILTHVSAVHLRYFGQAEAETAPAWHSGWRAQAVLPALIDIAANRKAGRPPMDFTVAPLLTHSPACRYDRIGPTCRRP
jgi:general secretion pathway protein J